MFLRLLSAFCALPLTVSAATSTAWEVSGFTDFLKGQLFGLSVDSDGTVQLGPSTRWAAALDQPALWSIAPAPDGALYAATGHNGKVFKISPSGKSTLLWSSEQAEVFAICVDAKGNLFAGTSPNGGLYLIQNGQAKQVWHSPVKYIWSLQPVPDGSIYIGTGEQGRIYRYDGRSATSAFYETNQSNVTALSLGPNGHLYAGTDPNGLLYDISSAGHARVLYDSTLPEIRSIAVAPNGTLYAAAMGGAVATRTPAGATPSATAASGPIVSAASPTVITVTESKDQASGTPADADQAVKAVDSSKTGISAASATPTATPSGVVEVSGVEKSAIYRIQPDGAVDNLRSSKEDNVYSLILDGDAIVFSTDNRGRIYRLSDGRTSLLSEPGSGETTRLLKIGVTLYASLSNPARLLAFAPPGSAPGSYQSQVHDAASVARWGHLQWHGSGTGIAFRTRTGFSARPDGTWSAWSEPITDPPQALISSPPARFIQFRAEWPATSSARVNTVDLPYLPQNGPPALHSITVSSVVGTNNAKSAAPSASAAAPYSITVTDTGEAPAASTASQSVSRLQTTQTQISWQADDPDNDKLVYSVHFRAEGATGWQLIRSRMFENTLLLDPDVFADGRYFFKVVASDSPSNAAPFAHQTELISSPVVIDNTPPLLTLGAPRRDADSLDIELEAHDKTSPLRLCEYSLDAGSWQPVEAVDGITDTPDEKFHLHLDKLRPGEHLLVFRVYDSANNAGLAKVLLR